jgi:hypothetical protein
LTLFANPIKIAVQNHEFFFNTKQLGRVFLCFHK